MNENDVRAVITASREVTHACANLAAVAAAAHHARPDGNDPTVNASMAAARAAFVLDDIYRVHNGSEQSLDAALEALETARQAITAASAAVRSARELRVKA